MSYDELKAKQLAESMNMCIHYVFLKKGPTWTPDETPQINRLQEAHLTNLRRLGEMGKLVLNGPLLDSFAVNGDMRGVGVIKADSLKEAEELLNTDPMVKAGRLIFEMHAWMVGKGILP